MNSSCLAGRSLGIMHAADCQWGNVALIFEGSTLLQPTT